MTSRPMLVVVLVVLALGALRPLLHRDIAVPPRIPAAQAAPWMADCLPGVGPKRLPAALTALRSGAWDQLPRQARQVDWFTP